MAEEITCYRCGGEVDVLKCINCDETWDFDRPPSSHEHNGFYYYYLPRCAKCKSTVPNCSC